ncbi:hypothetical protein TKK_0009823 [Trichogramma kaykai]|uniref:Ankyrin repeat protein n=1 Tax=Trichogramma kaykai TaxID=54128 RepID=A0ABD2X0V4_9HYME
MSDKVNERESLPLNFGDEFWSDRESLANLLMEAVKKNNKRIAKFIGQSGLQLSSYTIEDDVDLVNPTTIHVAFKKENFDILQILFDDYEHRLNLKWFHEKKILFQIACAVGRLDFIQKFIDNKVDVNKQVRLKNNWVTPLITAVQYAQHEAVELLLKNGALMNVNFSLAKGSVLHYVPMSHSDNSKLVELLCAWNADIEKTDRRRKSVLQNAASALNLPLVKALLSCGAKPESVKNLEGIRGSRSLIHLHILQHFENIMDELYKSILGEKIPLEVIHKVSEFTDESYPILLRADPKQVLQYSSPKNLVKYFNAAVEPKIFSESYDWLVDMIKTMLHYMVLDKKGLFDLAKPLQDIKIILVQIFVRLGMTDGIAKSIQGHITQKIDNELQLAKKIMVSENNSLLNFCKSRSDDKYMYNRFRIDVEKWLKSLDQEQISCISGYIKGHLA